MSELARQRQRVQAAAEAARESTQRAAERARLWGELTQEFIDEMHAARIGTVALQKVTRTPLLKRVGSFMEGHKMLPNGKDKWAHQILGHGWFIEEAVRKHDDHPKGLIILEQNIAVECLPNVVEVAPQVMPNIEVPYVGFDGKDLASSTLHGWINGPEGLWIGAAVERILRDRPYSNQ